MAQGPQPIISVSQHSTSFVFGRELEKATVSVQLRYGSLLALVTN